MQQRILNTLGKKVFPAILGITAAGSLHQHHRKQFSGVTRLEYWEHDPHDFDLYISNPTVNDLPVLLKKFDEDGMEVWPWIWTHPNKDGPHHVFIGINKDSLLEIQRLRDESEKNNILVIASQEELEEVANAMNDPKIYERCQCGLVVDSKVQLLNHEAKILMLDDERVIAFDRLMLV